MAVTTIPKMPILPIASLGLQPTARVRSKRKLTGKANKLCVAEIVEDASACMTAHEKNQRTKDTDKKKKQKRENAEDSDLLMNSFSSAGESSLGRRRASQGRIVQIESTHLQRDDEDIGESIVIAFNSDKGSARELGIKVLSPFRKPASPQQRAARQLRA